MYATCHQEGCPQAGTPVDVPPDAARVVCGSCQHVVTDLATDPPKPKRRRAT